MKLYHGSNCDFTMINLSKSKDKRDFGKGFYLTTLQRQAKEWAEVLFDRYGGDGIFVYEFDLKTNENLIIKKFDGLTEEWLNFIKDNRVKGGLQHNFDIVQGVVANDKTNRTLALFVEGVYTAKDALRKLHYNKLNDQISIHTEKALNGLTLSNKTAYGN
ncbi:hypothetical protein FACS189434_14440 [Bacteroidia bacterium]|nr:hypothetical protein FACS189434_14440 [Bacteroidia bacterium]